MSKARLILVIAASFALSTACNPNKYYALNGYAQGGQWTVKLNLRDSDLKPAQILDSINAILTDIDTTLSGYNRNSILSRRNAGENVPTNALFNDIQRIADDYLIKMEGALDVYSAPLFDIWGFGFKNSKLPDKDQIDEALRQCRLHKQVNFNAIAQGYSCDLIAAFLKRHGISDYLVDIGEIVCAGKNPSGSSWTIAIDTPEDGNESPGEKTSGTWSSNGRSCGVVTSGNYRKFYVVDGIKYSHTIDPRTGFPVRHNLLSATVIAPTGTEADALATYFMVIGFEKAREKVLSMEEVEACLITDSGTWTSPGF